LIWYLTSLGPGGIETFSSVLSNGLIMLIFLAFLLGGMYRKVNVFEAFVEGAKGGFDVAIRIIPYLVAMLVAISVLRNSGAFTFLTEGLSSLFSAMGMRTDFVSALPMTRFGADSFPGRLSAIFQGSSDTTFYVIAVYFGSVSIRNTRYAIPSMLLADLVGILTAIAVAYLFFGSTLS
jgi:spore maturation protein SpmB